MLTEKYTHILETQERTSQRLSSGSVSPRTTSSKSQASKTYQIDPGLPALVSVLDDLILQGEHEHAATCACDQIVSMHDEDPDAIEPFELTRARYMLPNASMLHPTVMNTSKREERGVFPEDDRFFAREDEIFDRPERAPMEKVAVGTSPFARDMIHLLLPER